MTAMLYQTDSYLKEFDARVVEQTDVGVVLDRTAFYPGGGGQPCDTGTLQAEDGSQWTVTAVRSMDGKVIHAINGKRPSAPRSRCTASSTGITDIP